MNVILFADVPYGDKDAWNDFMRDHAVAHQQIFTYLQLKSLQPETVVFPETNVDTMDWLDLNNRAHQETFRLLNIEGLVDLSQVDLNDEQGYNDWKLIHAQIHAIENKVAGL